MYVCYSVRLLQCTFVTVYEKEPPLPPSRAQKLAKEILAEDDYFMSIKRLMSNPGFVVFTISYGEFRTFSI